MEAPERIWAEADYNDHHNPATEDWTGGFWSSGDGTAKSVAYIRADLHAARIAELEADRDEAIAEAPATGAERAAWKDRAEKAEAEVARLRGLISDIIEAWDWWDKDQYDRCQSVPRDAIDAARAALQGETSNK